MKGQKKASVIRSTRLDRVILERELHIKRSIGLPLVIIFIPKEMVKVYIVVDL